MGGEHPEWLPLDWKVCVRVRSSGKKDKYYINPLNGLKFNSKLEVLRYLKNAENKLKLKKLNKVYVRKTVAEKLPPGWIKEIRVKKKGGKTRRDPYYIDPVSGCQFRSMQEVFRYLETKDSRKTEPNGDHQDHISEELGDHSKSSTAGAKELIDKKPDKIFTGNESVKSDDSLAGDLTDKLPQVSRKKRHEHRLSQNNRFPDSNLKSSEDAAVKNINTAETKTNASEQKEKEKISMQEDQQHENVERQNKRKKLNSKWMNKLPRRTSKRLARVEVDPSSEAREAAIQSGEAEVITTEKSATSHEPNEQNPKQQESTNLLLEEQEKPLDSSLNDLLMDPCIEFAVKTLTGAIPIEDLNKVDESPVSSLASTNQISGSSSVLPCGDIWTDPCFEFAVKMLTSEIPMEGGSCFQISFQQPFSSSNYSFSQTNPYTQQERVRDPSVTHAMSGGS